MSVQAEQYITLTEPSFVWIAKVKTGPFLTLHGRDQYQNGKGSMSIKLFSLIPIVNASGPEIDQGALLRFLAEIVWSPTAALSSYISWKQLSEFVAVATMSYGNVTGTANFVFTSEGDVASVDAMRYYQRKTGATLEKWHIDNDPESIREFQGIRIPTKSAVTWKLEEGDFTWFRLEITSMEYD